MAGVIFVLVLCLGGLAVLVVGVMSAISRTTHERSGLYGQALRRKHQEAEALMAALAEETARADLEALSQVVLALDRVALDGVPVVHVHPASRPGWWQVSFRDGTSLCVQPRDPRIMTRVNALAGTDPLVVSRVHPSGTVAFIELATPRHRPLRLALRA